MKLYDLILGSKCIVRAWDFLFISKKISVIITNICLKILCIFVILIIEILLFIFLIESSGLAV